MKAKEESKNTYSSKRIMQSSIEFITTYGFAILIISIALVLIYLFIYAPQASIPTTCTFSYGAYCNDLVLASNSVGSYAILLFTNTQQYTLINPQLLLNTTNSVSGVGQCKPNVVPPGGAIICNVTISGKSLGSTGSPVTGSLKLTGTACPSGNVNSCSGQQSQSYIGTFNTHLAPLLTSTPVSITLSASNLTQLAASGILDKLTATVTLLGYPLTGAAVNFTANQSFVIINPREANSNSNGNSVSYASSNNATGKVKITASFAGYNASIIINFTPSVFISFRVAGLTSSAQGNVLLGGIANTNALPINYSYSQFPLRIAVPLGSVLAYSFYSPIPSSASDTTRYIFTSATGCAQSTIQGYITATENCTVYATYATQYILTMSASPSGSGAVTPGTNWENASSQVTISETPVSPYAFNGWTGSGSGFYSGSNPTDNIVINNPISEVASFTSMTTTSTSTSITTTTITTTSTLTSLTSTTITSTTSTSTTSTSSTTILYTDQPTALYCYYYGWADQNEGGVPSLALGCFDSQGRVINELTLNQSGWPGFALYGVVVECAGAVTFTGCNNVAWFFNNQSLGVGTPCGAQPNPSTQDWLSWAVSTNNCGGRGATDNTDFRYNSGPDSVGATYPGPTSMPIYASGPNGGQTGSYNIPTASSQTSISGSNGYICLQGSQTGSTYPPNSGCSGTVINDPNGADTAHWYLEEFIPATSGSTGYLGPVCGTNWKTYVGSIYYSGSYTQIEGVASDNCVYPVTTSTTVTTTTATTTTATTTISGGGGGGGSSFAAGTLVNLVNGSMLPIQQLKPGDVILSYDPKTGSFYDNVVLNVLSFQTYGEYIINGEVETDAAELFYTNNYNWTSASRLQVGQSIFDPSTGTWIPVTSIKYVPRNLQVYDIVGSSGNNFIVDGKYFVDLNTL